ncbi:probable GUF1 - GTP-binding protein [Moesziomyces antarcticus]|uniref:Probable GUF1 - GTP-binding protein n=1 Tax=Pseudozyma antarctica TaxID=84753 RepID=A0A5C3FLI9_PSEA2|nr:probable GUF1 - GTP-binding protein [Moesziomyces antarcticus]
MLRSACRRAGPSVAGRLSVSIAGPSARPSARVTDASGSSQPSSLHLRRLPIARISAQDRSITTSIPRTSASSSSGSAPKPSARDFSKFDRLETRTFSIISHVDHGKSTLADRLLELTGTIPQDGSNQQVLDKLKVERERGITVKSQAVTMVYDYDGPRPDFISAFGDGFAPKPGRYLLNLIDCPGHVDFSYEVSRSLSACQSALLVVDATQGVQAQSITVFELAKQKDLAIVPVLNKSDLPAADADRCALQMEEILGIDTTLPGQEPLLISAKTGQGVDSVLRALVERTKPPPGVEDGKLEGREGPGFRALVFDSWYDQYKGVVSLVSIADGAVKKGDRITSCHTGKRYEVLSLGVNSPEMIATDVLRKGQVGWIIANMKDMSEAQIGDTFHLSSEKVEPLEGFAPTVPMVYAGIFPIETTDFLKLEEAIQRLALNDRSVTVQRESSMALGQGCRLGFLGLLHLDVFRQRLEDEYGHAILVTAPSVPYKVTWRDGREEIVSNPIHFPDDSERKGKVTLLEEPMVRGVVRCPEEYTGEIMQLCAEHRGEQLDVSFPPTASAIRSVQMTYRLPLSEIVTDFFDKLKSCSSGFASFEYSEDGYQASDLVKLNFLISNTVLDSLSIIMHRSKVLYNARAWTKKLKDIIPRQQFEVSIQATTGSKVIARETLSAYRKDVTAGLYGGHYERKLKHLNKQKEGKKRLKALGVGRVQIPTEKFLEVLDTRSKAK